MRRRNDHNLERRHFQHQLYFFFHFGIEIKCSNRISESMNQTKFASYRVFTPTKNLHCNMHVIPSILITTPIFDEDDCSLPSIIVTRDSEDHIDSTDISDADDSQEDGVEYVSIFPEYIFEAAR